MLLKPTLLSARLIDLGKCIQVASSSASSSEKSNLDFIPTKYSNTEKRHQLAGDDGTGTTTLLL